MASQVKGGASGLMMEAWTSRETAREGKDAAAGTGGGREMEREGEREERGLRRMHERERWLRGGRIGKRGAWNIRIIDEPVTTIYLYTPIAFIFPVLMFLLYSSSSYSTFNLYLPTEKEDFRTLK